MFAMRRFSAATALSLSMLLLGSGVAAAEPNGSPGPDGSQQDELTYEQFKKWRCDLDPENEDGGEAQASGRQRQKPTTEDACGEAFERFKERLEERKDEGDDDESWEHGESHWKKRFKHHRGHRGYEGKRGHGDHQLPKRHHDHGSWGEGDDECKRYFSSCDDEKPRHQKRYHKKQWKHDSDWNDADRCECRRWNEDDWDEYEQYPSGEKAHSYWKKARHHDDTGDYWTKRSKRYDRKADRSWDQYHSYKGHDWKRAEGYRTRAKKYERHADLCEKRAQKNYHRADYNEDEAEQLIELLEFLLELLQQRQSQEA